MKRRRVSELMDGPGLGAAEHERALRALNRVNRLSGVDRSLARALWTVGMRGGSIVDIACGGGGFLGAIQKDAKLSPAFLLGMDLSVFALGCAAVWQPGAIRWVVADGCRLPLADGSADLVTCSLFLHHLDEGQAVALLGEAWRVARRGVVVADLVRSRVSLLVTWVVTRLISRSRVFRVDGPRSVRGAFTIGELAELARRAGLDQVTVRRCFPFRALLVARKTDDGGGLAV